MKILDATAGTRSIWYQKDLPFVTFMDKRKETIRSNHKKGNKRNIKIDPDIISEWKDAPFEDNYFDMIVFDPPHLIRKEEWSDSTMVKSYGKLFQHNYKHVLKEGVDKLFKILKPDGIFILKWCDTDRPVEEIIKF
jgi:23S rRNA G2069 N7-methylase RlmK/C1962 C5-methylase RlmI